VRFLPLFEISAIYSNVFDVAHVFSDLRENAFFSFQFILPEVHSNQKENGKTLV